MFTQCLLTDSIRASMPGMTYREVLEHYKTNTAIADILGISRASITRWKKSGVPPRRQYELEELSGGRLQRRRKKKILAD